MQVADTHSYIVDTHFNTEKERICIFNDETNQIKGKTKFQFKKHFNGIGSPTSFSWRFLDYRKTKQLPWNLNKNASAQYAK